MSARRFAWWLAGLWGLAVLLALAGLGGLPLRDWDEGIAARVALELAQRPWPEVLLPTYWGEPYLNKPPGLHALIALCIQLWRRLSGSGPEALPPEAVVRLVPALLSTLVVPLGALIQRQLRPNDRGSALATAAILLSLLPLARHGRLAMLDGSQLSAIALLWWCLLRSRGPGPSWRPGLEAGLAGSALLLLKAPLLLPPLTAGLLGLTLDPGFLRRRWPLLLVALAAGLLPGLAWHGWHGWMRGELALRLWLGDGAGRVLLQAGEGSDLRWRLPLLELLKGGWPWLPLWPFGLALAWRERQRASGRWGLVLQGVMAAAILPLRTQLPWYSHPLWLPFALLCAPVLRWLLQPWPASEGPAPPRQRWLLALPWLWMALGALLLTAAAASLLPQLGPLDALGDPADPADLAAARPLLLATGAGWLLGGLLLRSPAAPNRLRRRRLGAAALLAGNLLALLLLLSGPLWLWELRETWPAPPLAALVRQHAATGPIWIQGQAERPSLNWYAGERIRRLRSSSLKRLASADAPPQWRLLSRSRTPGERAAALADCRLQGGAEGWWLLRCDRAQQLP
ncbi:MAG: 4-amino-4-deoxy-L-arabinose transferase [Synechococcaceae cyanobacterium]|nr:4-amino-4-deoxy-L-arabinose transferase [Synechococcaceae cyanobacterium]